MAFDGHDVFDIIPFSSHVIAFVKKQISVVKILPLGISLGKDDGSELGWSEGTSIDKTLELVKSSEG